MISFRVTTTGRPVRVQLYRRTPEGPFHATFFWRGKRHRISTDHHVEREARAAAKLAVQKASEEIQHNNANTLPLSKAVELFLNECWPERTGSTHRNIEGRINRFVLTVGADIDLVTTGFDPLIEIIQNYLNGRVKAKKTARTVVNEKLVLSRFFTWLSKRQPRLVPWRGNPASSAYLNIPQPQASARPPLPPAIQRRLIEATEGTVIWPMVVLCLGAGMRPIEAFRSHWDQIDIEQGLGPARAKRKARLVPLCPSLRTYLAGYRRPGEPVWAGNFDRPHQILADIRTQAGLPKDVTFQAMRRTAAVRIAREVDTMTYAMILGHSLATAEKHYLEAKALMLNDPLHPDAWPFSARPPQKAPQMKVDESQTKQK